MRLVFWCFDGRTARHTYSRNRSGAKYHQPARQSLKRTVQIGAARALPLGAFWPSRGCHERLTWPPDWPSCSSVAFFSCRVLVICSSRGGCRQGAQGSAMGRKFHQRRLVGTWFEVSTTVVIGACRRPVLCPRLVLARQGDQKGCTSPRIGFPTLSVPVVPRFQSMPP